MSAPSTPMDFNAPINWNDIKGKTAIITGAGSGFGRQIAIEFAKRGAFLILADINEKAGQESCEMVRAAAGGSRLHHFIHCDVTSFRSQSALFRRAIKASPGGHVDIVIANAGISESGLGVNFPVVEGDANTPPVPNLATLDINIHGLIITSHLAYWAFSLPTRTPQLHHLVLLGSMASFVPAPGAPLYNASKHAVMGLFRSLRAPDLAVKNAPPKATGGPAKPLVHVNMICPYFAPTPLLYTHTKRGSPEDLANLVKLAKIEDVVEAAGRLVTTRGGREGGGRAVVVANEDIARGRGRGGIYELVEIRGRL